MTADRAFEPDVPRATLIRVVPTEAGSGLVLEFGSGDIRIFDCLDARLQRDRPEADWSVLSFPEKRKHLTFDADKVSWPGDKVLGADYLLARSRRLSEPELESQSLRVAYRNQAPTREDPTHHVYSVYVKAFAAKPFVIGESIGGGHGERGGQTTLTRAELLARPDWQQQCEMSGCDWAVSLIATDGIEERACVDAIVREVCRRADTDESDVAGYDPKGRPGRR